MTTTTTLNRGRPMPSWWRLAVRPTAATTFFGFLGVFHEAFPGLRLEVKQLVADRSAAAAEGTIVGTHTGVLHTPNGDVPPTGRSVELPWAAVYLIEDDTLKSEHLFFDQMDFLGQLGLLPS